MRRSMSRRRPRAFTLIELLVVITIIGIIITFIVIAATDGIRRAEERATQALITKLESAVNDRLDAIMDQAPTVNRTHRVMAAVYNSVVPATFPSAERAQVIARADQIRTELPDVWHPDIFAGAGAGSYHINFGSMPYPSAGGAATLPDSHGLPLGVRVADTNGGAVSTGAFSGPNPIDGPTGYPPDPNYSFTGNGIMGASYTAAAGIYKNLGFAQIGYDGVDNNGNGFIDDFAEGGNAVATANMANHTHNTARSEMLYALLVEGLGPLGSVFTPDQFTDREVRDTDGDGLPEFIDAWGQPLQFFRWPVFFTEFEPGLVPPMDTSTLFQRGTVPYNNLTEPRHQNPLDPNQLLVAPMWWSSITGANAANALGPPGTYASTGFALTAVPNMSRCADEFEQHFFPLHDPAFQANAVGPNWDRSGVFARRAYFSKFLIVSSGPDKTLGIVMETDASLASFSLLQRMHALHNEGWALPVAPSTDDVGADDISNQNIQGPGTGVR